MTSSFPILPAYVSPLDLAMAHHYVIHVKKRIIILEHEFQRFVRTALQSIPDDQDCLLRSTRGDAGFDESEYTDTIKEIASRLIEVYENTYWVEKPSKKELSISQSVR